VHAYGAAEGVERFKAFDAAVDTAEASFAMRTMPAEEIADLVENAMPQQGGDMAAVEQKRFDALQTAAAATLDARDKDAAGYVMEVFPGVASAWQAVQENPNDPTALAAAYTATATAQESLGMNLELLPKAHAESIAKAFQNRDLPEDDRLGAVKQVLFATKDEGYQAAIFDQLVDSGLPPTTKGAFAALERGDAGASDRLFRAAMLDPAKLPGKLPETATRIDEVIQDTFFEAGQVGDIVYGLTGGRMENFTRFQDDGTLLTNAVKLRLLDGSASSLEQAVQLAGKDVFGDVKAYVGKPWGGGAGVRIALPAGADPAPYQSGFDALLGQVGDALMANLTPAVAGGSTNNSQAEILTQARDDRVAAILEEGYFAPAGSDEFVFVDHDTGQAITNPDGSGGLLSWTTEEVKAAGSTAAAAAAENGRPSNIPTYMPRGY
jgi:hypothetical protein